MSSKLTTVEARMHPGRRQGGFTLVEIMTVVGIIGIVTAIAVTTWLRQREIARSMACQEQLLKIDQLTEVYAAETRLSNGSSITYPDDLVQSQGTGYLKKEPKCPAGGVYTIARIGDTPTCSIGSDTLFAPPHVIP